MAQGIILAAGYSSRAQTNKMLLVYNQKPLIVHAIDGMRPFVTEIFVVTGHFHEEIKEVIEHLPGVHIIHNERYGEGMFTSVMAGVSRTTEDFFVLPGDCPFVKASTYEKILRGTATVRVPTYLGRTGHPLFIKAELRDELLAEPRISNLKLFRNQHNYEIIKTDDSNILTDIDTPEDYHSLKHSLGKDNKHGN
jgi:molybdenum cofactor cytidylyltransferase